LETNLLFLIMSVIWRALISTLFPYTTLFRSSRKRLQMSWFLGWFATMNLMKSVGLVGQVIFGSRFFVQWFASERLKRSVIPLALDRKSTRLNSSHVKISYAVFCLKKKKTGIE